MLSSDTTYSVVIIGTGFGGQAAAIALQKAGIDDVVMLERRAFMGGTWRQNSYPGAAVDVQSPLYSLASEPYPWTQMFAGQQELSDYTGHVLAKYGLQERVLTSTTVQQVRWNGELWEIDTAERGTIRGRYVINASGPLSKAVIRTSPAATTTRASPSTRTSGITTSTTAASAWPSSARARAPRRSSRPSSLRSASCTCSSARRTG